MTATLDTKTKLLDAAQELIQRHGINGMSFQDLSDAVGIRKASVHHHFATKADMVNALSQRQLARFQEALKKILNAKASGRTKLKRYGDLFVATLKSGKQEKGCLFGMLMAEYMCVQRDAQKEVGAFLEANLEFLTSVLKQGQQDGSLENVRRVRATAGLVLSAAEGGLFVARCEGGHKRLSEVMLQLIDYLSE